MGSGLSVRRILSMNVSVERASSVLSPVFMRVLSVREVGDLRIGQVSVSDWAWAMKARTRIAARMAVRGIVETYESRIYKILRCRAAGRPEAWR